MEFVDPNQYEDSPDDQKDSSSVSEQDSANQQGYGFFSWSSSATKPKKQEQSSFWSYLKEKTEVISEVIKNDVSEFARVITEDTKEVITHTIIKPDKHDDHEPQSSTSLPKSKSSTDVLSDLNKEGPLVSTASISYLSKHVSTSLAWFSDILDENSNFVKMPGDQTQDIQILNRHDAKLLAIQRDIATFTTAPTPENTYRTWVANFDLNSKTEAIAQLLSTQDEIRALHHKLVPNSVSHSDFWNRYFYRVHKFEEDEARRQALLKKTVEAQEEEDIGWDVGDEEYQQTGQDEANSAQTLKSQSGEQKETPISEQVGLLTDTDEPDVEINLQSLTTKESPVVSIHEQNLPEDLPEVSSIQSESHPTSGAESPESTGLVIVHSPKAVPESHLQDPMPENISTEYEVLVHPKEKCAGLSQNNEPKGKPSDSLQRGSVTKEATTDADDWDDWE